MRGTHEALYRLADPGCTASYFSACGACSDRAGRARADLRSSCAQRRCGLILPIHLTGRLGLPGATGVPSFTLDANGQIAGSQFWPQGSNGEDIATGEPVTAESGSPDYSNDAALWDSPQMIGPATSINTQSLRDSRGTQWKRHGSYQTESSFDKWRRMGKPTTCSMSGIGDTWPDGSPCVPGSGPLCMTTAHRIAQAIAIGASAAAAPQYGMPGYGNQYGGPGYNNPQVAIGGSATPGAWILGGLAAVAVLWVISRRS